MSRRTVASPDWADNNSETIVELYHNNMSVCSQRVRLVLREKGLDPVEHHLDLRVGESHTPEYLTLNPNGVVPTLIDQGHPIIESSVICEYLDEAYPNPPMRPDDALSRARMRLWTIRPDAGLHHACGTISIALAFRHQMAEARGKQFDNRPNADETEYYRRIAREGLDAPGVPEAVRYYDKTLNDMNASLEVAPWLAGGVYSLAEVTMIPYVVRLEHLNLTWLWEAHRPSIRRWLERCKARSNYGAVTDYIEPKYLDLMGPAGLKASERIKGFLAV